MKIALFGATGLSGLEVIKQALEKNHSINAFVRDPQKLTIQNENIKVIVGDVTEKTNIEEVIKGTDAVVVTLGSRLDTAPDVLAKGTQNIIETMKQNNVSRIVVMSSYPMSGTEEGKNFLRQAGVTEEQLEGMKSMLEDKINQEKITRESGLKWTIIRPLMLTDKPKTGTYRVGEKIDVKLGDTISRADVADFILKAIEDESTQEKTLILVN